MELGEVSGSHMTLAYLSSTPIETLRFHETGGYFRERRWEVLTAGYVIARDGAAQLVQVDDGAEAQLAVEVRVNLEADSHPRRYDHAVRFTNGWTAIYSGYLDAVGMVASKPTYIVLGLADWNEGGGIRYLVDPALPEWMSYSTMRHLPSILEVYRERFELELGVPVQVLISFHPHSDVTELRGAALPGQIHVGVHGTEWQEDSPWAERRLHQLIAHEAAHLWNAGLVRYAEGTSPSLYEGGAEALGIRALFTLGLVDDAMMLASADEVAERCLAGTVRRDYACGHDHANQIERQSLAQGGPDLFSLWGQLLRDAQSGDGHYDEHAWEAVVASAGAGISPCRGDTGAHRAVGTGC